MSSKHLHGLSLLLAGGLVAGQGLAFGPDFTGLVEQAVPAVVNIETTQFGRRGPEAAPSQQLPEDVPEFFRRFFDPFGEGVPRSQPDRQGGGSGFIFRSDGLVITNHHVIDGADEILVRLHDRREYLAELIGSDAETDVAVLKIEASDLPVLELGDSRDLRPGEWVIAIGSPFRFEQSVSAGIVSAKGRTQGQQQYVPFIQTDVAINRGNSGGPLINRHGQVVGINSWILSSHGGNIGLSFSIPIEVASNTIGQLLEYGRVSRGFLGVGIEGISRQKADALGLDRPVGALVNRLEPGGAAERAGIEVGDVILKVDGREVEVFSDLPPLVGAVRPGEPVELELSRWGEKRVVTAVLDERQEDPAADMPGQRPDREPSNALGLTVEPLTEDQIRRMADVQGGVLVVAVDSDNAHRAGLRRGDVILQINNAPIRSIDDFNRLVEELPPGRTVALLAWRNGVTQFFAYTPEVDD